MKKIFTTVLIVASTLGISSAQSLSTNGMVPVIYGYSTDFQLQSEFEVINNSANDLNVYLEKHELSIVPGSTNNFCWGPQCYGPSTFVSPSPSLISANGGVDVTFRGDYQPNGFPGASQIGYCFYDGNNTADSVCVIITFDATATGINNLPAANNYATVYPSPANNMATLSYNFKDTKGEFKVYDVLGNLVRTIIPKNQSGTLVLQVSDLKQGVYFVSMVSNGKSLANTKLIVKH